MKKRPILPIYVTKSGKVYRANKTEASQSTARGYKKVSIKHDGIYKAHFVHRLVLETYVGPCPKDMQTRHLNGVRHDNRLRNLRWGTHAENYADVCKHDPTGIRFKKKGLSLARAIAEGRFKMYYGEDHKNAKLTNDQVREMLTWKKTHGYGQNTLSRMYKISPRIVQGILANTRWKHIDRSTI